MKLVLISEKTFRKDINNIGDVDSWHDDDVVLGPAYDIFDVIEIKELTVADFLTKINAVLPEARTIFRLDVPQNEWTFEDPERMKVYKDGEQWKEISEPPKYMMQIDKKEIGNFTGTASKESKLSALETAIIPNVKSDKNQTVINVYDSSKVK